MALKLIGAVGVKVRPEAEDFRDQAERQIRRQFRDGKGGGDVEVNVRPKLDTERMRKDFARHRDSMKRTLNVLMDDMEVQAPRMDGSNFMREAMKIQSSGKKMYSELAKVRDKFHQQERQGWKNLSKAVADYDKTVASSTSGLKGRREIVKAMDEIAFRQSEITRLVREQQKVQRQADSAAADNIQKYVTHLNEARGYLKDLKDEQREIDAAGFRGVSNALKAMNGELQKSSTISGHVRKSLAELGREAAAKKMQISVDVMKAYEDAERFRRLWSLIPDHERKTVAVRLQMEDNRVIEKFQEFKRELESLETLKLRERMRKFAKGTREHAAAQEILNERLREARRVNAGWQEQNDAMANQMRDNARITREVEAAERLRNMTNANLRSTMQGLSRDSAEYAHYLGEVRRRLDEVHERQRWGWTHNGEGGNQHRQQLDNDRVRIEYEENLRKIREEAKRTRDYIDDLDAEMTVGLSGTEAAAAHMAWLTRPRTVPIHVRVTGKSLAIAEGVLQSLTGMNALRKLGSGFENIIKQYDKFTIVTSLVTAAVGNLVNVLVGGVASIFSVGQGLAHVLQGVAMAPTLFGAIATSAVVATTALGDFFSALASGDYSSLTGNALKNAEMLKGSWTDLSEVIKENFWAEAGTSMAEFVNKALPTLRRGLGDTATEMGKLWDGVWTSFERALDVGYLDGMFAGLSGFMRELAGAAEPAMNAIMQLGARGAEHLPKLGVWLRDGAEGFEQFIAEADEAGKIDQWIENSANAIQDLGVVARGAGKMMEGLSRAALEAGGPSLEQFANAMDRWGDAVQSARGQDILGDLFAGAYDGLSRLGDGMGNFFSTLGDHMDWLRDVMSQSGGIGGALFDSLATIFDNDKFRDGTLQGLVDIEQATRDLEPAFDAAAGVIGDMARVSGAVLKGIAPTINEIVGLTGDMVGTLVDPLIDLIPRLTSSMGALVGVIEPGVKGATTAVAGLIDGFNGLPGPIQTALLTAAGLVALRPHMRSLADSVAKQVLPAYTRWGQSARALQEEHAKQGRDISMMTAGYRTFKQEMAGSARMATQSIAPIRNELANVNRELGNYRTIGGKAWVQVGNRMIQADETYQRLVARQRDLNGSLREAEVGATRMGAAFSAIDRLTGSSLFGVAEGAAQARDGIRNLGGAVANAVIPLSRFGDASSVVGERVRTSFARMYASVSDFGRGVAGRFDLVAGQFRQLGDGIAGEERRFAAPLQNMTAAVANFDQRMRLISGANTFGSFNTQVSNLGTVAARAKTGFTQISDGVQAATRAIGSTAASGLRAATTGLIGAMGGPWGVALAGAAIGFGIYAQRVNDAKSRVQEYRDTLNPVTGAITEQTKALGAHNATQELVDLGFWQTGRSAMDMAEVIGVSSSTMAEAYAGNKDAIDEVIEANQRWRDSGEEAWNVNQNAASSQLAEDLERVGVETELAAEQTRQMADAMGISSEKAIVLDQAWQGFTQTVRSGTVEGEQMVAMMDQLTGGTLAAQDAAFNYESSLANMGTNLKTWAAQSGDAISGINKHFEDGAKTLDMTKQSHRELYSILRQQVEPAFQQVADVFNSYGGGEAGIQAARDTMAGIRDDMFTHLTEIEGMGADTANALLDSLNIKPDAVEMVLKKSAAEQSLEEISNSLKMLTGEAFVAEVSIERDGFDPLVSDAENAKEQLFALTSPTYRAMLEAEDRLSPVLDDVTSSASQLAIKDWLVMIAAQDNASGTVNAVRAALEGGFQGKSYEAVLTVLDNATGVSQKARDQIMAGFVQGDYEAVMTAVDEAGPKAEELRGQLETIFNGQDYQATLNADGTDASTETERVADAIDRIDNKTAVVNVTNTGADSLERQLARIDAFQDKTVVVRVTNTGADSLNRMKARIDAIKDKSAKVTVTNSGAESLVRLKGRMDAIRSKSAKVTVTNSGQDSLVRLKQKIDAVKSKSEKVTVTNSGQDSLVRLKAKIDAIKSKSAHVSVTTSGHGSLASLRSAINSVRGKTVTVRVRTAGSANPYADGGIDNGFGVRMFANGGITQMGKILDRRMRLAWENHTAQIAPAGAMRVWAEPETGGEAYIPLSTSKRTRSEDILGEVANRFGGEFVNSRGESSRGGAVQAEGNNYTVNVQTLRPDVAEEVTADIMFNLKHLEYGGGRSDGF